jgi:Coenzyme PQQ synthesis protein D (PqqD)
VKPHARKEKLTIRAMSDETLVYDLEQHKVHCLNRTSALLWQHCDGQNDEAALAAILARALGLGAADAAAAVRLGLAQLSRRHLLQAAVPPLPESEHLSRRAALRRIAVAATVALPLVMTLKSPSVAWARSMAGQFTGCITDFDCQFGQTCTQHFGPHISSAHGVCGGAANSSPFTEAAQAAAALVKTPVRTCALAPGTPCPTPIPAGCQCPNGVII